MKLLSFLDYQVLVISDVFTQRAQYEWMFDTLLEVNKNHPVEDELVTQYAVPGICKAASILGLVSKNCNTTDFHTFADTDKVLHIFAYKYFTDQL